MCDLCELKKLTRWYTKRNEDGIWTIVDCKSCHIPMAVYYKHTMYTPPLHLKALYDLVNNHQELWDYQLWRCQARKILDHFHVHLMVGRSKV